MKIEIKLKNSKSCDGYAYILLKESGIVVRKIKESDL